MFFTFHRALYSDPDNPNDDLNKNDGVPNRLNTASEHRG